MVLKIKLKQNRHYFKEITFLFDEAYKNLEEVENYKYEYEAFIKDDFVHYTPKNFIYSSLIEQYEHY